MFQAAIDAAHPARVLPPHLPRPPRGRTIVIGAGKAGGAMAKAVEEHWTGPLEGLVVTRYGQGVPCSRIKVVEAGHPVPDEAGRYAAECILGLVQGLTPDDLVLCLISGGGSALLALPAEGITFADKQAVNKVLLRSGAAIGEAGRQLFQGAAVTGEIAEHASTTRFPNVALSDLCTAPGAICLGLVHR